MTVDSVLVQRGLYADSVALLQISQTLSQRPGVRTAQVAMATELNLQVLAGMGFVLPEQEWTGNEMVIAVRAEDTESAGAAADAVAGLLARPAGTQGGETTSGASAAPRTIGSASQLFGPGLALISVPGQHAFTEAMDALDSGNDVLLFSDNVTVAQEIRLKERAAELGLLVMGPDCGTAVVNGVGLGFSHTVQAGPVGLVAASGTGAQQVLALLDTAGVGVSAALGVGGRDLSAEVAGRSSLAAMRLLEDDPGTELILVVSKPPAPEVSEQLHRAARHLSTPVEFALLGPGQPDLTAATERAIGLLHRRIPDWPAWIADDGQRSRPGWLRGLFCGGTLCDEAMLLASGSLGPIRSNIALTGAQQLDGFSVAPDRTVEGHSMIDFGSDELTRGRAHPMIDPSLRTQAVQAALLDPQTGVVLLDVVLGHGAHPDPAGVLLPVLNARSAGAPPVVVSLIGTRQDPQNATATAERLHQAGASVFASNAAATRHALALLGGAQPSGHGVTA
ncbi:hypothetical protein M6D93_08760 [Jatrophihabitans telluris]|uniref:ATP-citrate synthase/succinyl-CoA ligase C-terminal domain-containing protein n=1 Tax=Jatrophihabitans telluris TaxID=2038343 RepID=A0ABY4R3H7_9ACTN|nr:hypothetical protein [Jatrophihabitans telluris]UQX90077.1 hypothetical protein M6D93_08760 [Jatrophihabitans telluris]